MTFSKLKTMKKDRGFTIVELLIVIIIIAILAAIVIVAYNGITNRAKTSKALSAAQAVQQKTEAYNAEKGYYPYATNGSDLTGASSTLSYYLTGVTFAAADITAAPAAESTVYMKPCPVATATATTSTGDSIKYWDYTTGAAVTITSGSGCP
jgi:prepilin-type N-terminal cleavage/methylation domain-containing protein